MIVALTLTVFSPNDDNFFIYFLRQVIILSFIAPVSMSLNLDLSRLYFSFMVQSDYDIPNAKCRNSDVQEDLG
jgi:phospholipid-translocating ATPase